MKNSLERRGRGRGREVAYKGGGREVENKGI